MIEISGLLRKAETQKTESQKTEFLKSPNHKKSKSGQNGQVDLYSRAPVSAILFIPNLKWSKKFGPNFTE
jgi:hypothetical protein